MKHLIGLLCLVWSTTLLAQPNAYDFKSSVKQDLQVCGLGENAIAPEAENLAKHDMATCLPLRVHQPEKYCKCLADVQIADLDLAKAESQAKKLLTEAVRIRISRTISELDSHYGQCAQLQALVLSGHQLNPATMGSLKSCPAEDMKKSFDKFSQNSAECPSPDAAAVYEKLNSVKDWRSEYKDKKYRDKHVNGFSLDNCGITIPDVKNRYGVGKCISHEEILFGNAIPNKDVATIFANKKVRLADGSLRKLEPADFSIAHLISLKTEYRRKGQTLPKDLDRLLDYLKKNPAISSLLSSVAVYDASALKEDGVGKGRFLTLEEMKSYQGQDCNAQKSTLQTVCQLSQQSLQSYNKFDEDLSRVAKMGWDLHETSNASARDSLYKEFKSFFQSRANNAAYINQKHDSQLRFCHIISDTLAKTACSETLGMDNDLFLNSVLKPDFFPSPVNCGKGFTDLASFKDQQYGKCIGLDRVQCTMARSSSKDNLPDSIPDFAFANDSKYGKSYEKTDLIDKDYQQQNDRLCKGLDTKIAAYCQANKKPNQTVQACQDEIYQNPKTSKFYEIRKEHFAQVMQNGQLSDESVVLAKGLMALGNEAGQTLIPVSEGSSPDEFYEQLVGSMETDPGEWDEGEEDFQVSSGGFAVRRSGVIAGDTPMIAPDQRQVGLPFDFSVNNQPSSTDPASIQSYMERALANVSANGVDQKQVINNIEEFLDKEEVRVNQKIDEVQKEITVAENAAKVDPSIQAKLDELTAQRDQLMKELDEIRKSRELLAQVKQTGSLPIASSFTGGTMGGGNNNGLSVFPAAANNTTGSAVQEFGQGSIGSQGFGSNAINGPVNTPVISGLSKREQSYVATLPPESRDLVLTEIENSVKLDQPQLVLLKGAINGKSVDQIELRALIEGIISGNKALDKSAGEIVVEDNGTKIFVRYKWDEKTQKYQIQKVPIKTYVKARVDRQNFFLDRIKQIFKRDDRAPASN